MGRGAEVPLVSDYYDHAERIGYDLAAALGHNGLSDKCETIQSVALTIEGENDGASWHWIVRLTNGKWAYVTGGCDYTGWDCQSGCDWVGDALTRRDVLTLVGDDERRVFADMIAKRETSRPNTGGL